MKNLLQVMLASFLVGCTTMPTSNQELGDGYPFGSTRDFVEAARDGAAQVWPDGLTQTADRMLSALDALIEQNEVTRNLNVALMRSQFPTEEYVDTAQRSGGLVACPTCETPVNEHWLRKRLRSLQRKDKDGQ